MHRENQAAILPPKRSAPRALCALLGLALSAQLSACDDQSSQGLAPRGGGEMEGGSSAGSPKPAGAGSSSIPVWSAESPLSSVTLEADSLHGRCLSLSLSGGLDYQPQGLELSLGASVSALRLDATDLGAYLLLDQEGAALSLTEAGSLSLLTQALPGPYGDEGRSLSVWLLEPHPDRASFWRLRNANTEAPLSAALLELEGFAAPEEPLVIALEEAEGCAELAELSLDASGLPSVTTQPEAPSELFGLVDAHAHLFANLGFGPGVHGAPFHPLGPAFALESCEQTHGPEGRRDLWGYFSDHQDEGANIQGLIGTLAAGQTPSANHATDGYPSFSDWPSGPSRATHQTMYYRWLERAWLGGLRLMVLHAVANEVICELQRHLHPQPELYQCNEMESVRASIEAARRLERYIDAKMGGAGRGFFRIVESPAEAREVIREGKLAIILGVETSNLFDCFSTTERAGRPRCDEGHLEAELSAIHELGVRVMFPVHKFDNGFSAGDGHRGVIELANFVNSGQYSSFTQDCPSDAPERFDHGPVFFSGLNQPRDAQLAPQDVEVSAYGPEPLNTLLPYLELLNQGPLEGDWCQQHGLTPLGERLLKGMMERGMLIELDHFPRRSYKRAFELLEEQAYPGAVGTHGESFGGRLYELGGLSKVNLGRCQSPDEPLAPISSLRRELEQINEAGAYPGVGFAFDLNGFAGAPGPRFGEASRCSSPQSEPLSYPFSSFAGDVSFTPPQLGERALDFNEEGLTHIGLLPELIEDAMRMGVPKEELAPLFRSAEAYIRVWEGAERRGRELREASGG